MGLDYSFGLNGSDGEHVPVLSETIIFDDNVEDYQTHCCTWEQAEAMHVKAVAVATDWAKAGEAAVARLKELLEDRHDGQASN